MASGLPVGPVMRTPFSVASVAPVALVLAFSTGCKRAPQPEPGITTLTSGTPVTTAPVTQVTDVSSLVEKVKGMVVNITVEGRAQALQTDSPLDFFFRNPGAEPRKQRGLGSGFLVDAQGHVLTNAHVVEGAEVVKVKLADDRELDARVKGVDPKTDIALLEVQGARDLPFATLGSSEAIKVGEPVIAIGNPFGLGNTVTTGIVSAKGRAIGAGPYDDFIQTDASINPGNSGGPLFDSRGHVIGMNTAIVPAGQGIGFAIPSDELKSVLRQLVATGHVERGRLGAQIQDVDEKRAKSLGLPSTRGAFVGEVEKGGPAERAGLKNGDVIVGVDSIDIPHAHDLPRTIAKNPPGTRVTLKVRRGGQELSLPVTLDKLEDRRALTAPDKRR
jgi:serine protease Do